MNQSVSLAKVFTNAGIVFVIIAIATWLLMSLGYMRGGAERYGLLFATGVISLLLGLLFRIGNKGAGVE